MGRVETRRHVSLRLGREGIQHVESRAKRAGVRRSEMIRWMLFYAAQHMPEDWRPRAGES